MMELDDGNCRQPSQSLLQGALGLGALASFRPMFVAYAVLAVITALGPSAPFLVGGTVKIAYNLTLWWMFRRVKPPEEVAGR